MQTVVNAHEMRRKALLQLLLVDFTHTKFEELNEEFIDECLPLLFDIFSHSKVYQLGFPKFQP